MEEVDRVKELPDLMGKLDEMGLTHEYIAYRERYMAWRTGDAHGADGELRADMHQKAGTGFGFWYPSLQVWQWRRTLSYWIAVTFFEGSIFFTLSSFLWCYAEELGTMKEALTKWGLVGGKINFIVCTYLMCIETINLTADHEEQRRTTIDKLTGAAAGGASSSEDESSTHDIGEDPSESDGPGWECLGEGEGQRRKSAVHAERFYLNPFRARKALRNLKRLGCGPWPYWASLIYLLGVAAFTVGLVAEFCTFLPHDVMEWTLLISFELGSLMFLGGGLMECAENNVFTTCSVSDQGWWGAIFNTMGGVGFLVGATLGFAPGYDYAANFSYGVGSFIFAMGSGVQIVMWKDEQFGLTFLAVLNDGRPKVLTSQRELEEASTFTPTGTIFIMIYCLASALSFYTVTIALTAVQLQAEVGLALVISNAVNDFLPCLFAHIMLALNSAVIKSPKMSPFRQLYFAARIVAIIMVINSACRISEAVYLANWELHHPGEFRTGQDCNLAHLASLS